MRLLYASLLVLALAVPARAQWQSVAPGFKYERIQGGSGFLLRYSLTGGTRTMLEFYCALTISRDGGATWAPTGLRTPSDNAATTYSCLLAPAYFDASPDGSLTAYLETDAGARAVYRTTDGVAWAPLGAVPPGEQRLFPRAVGSTVLAHPSPNQGTDRARLLRLNGGVWTEATRVPGITPAGDLSPGIPAIMGSLPHAGGRRTYGRGNRTTAGRTERIVYVSDDLATWAPAPAADSLATTAGVLDFGTGAGLVDADPYRLAYVPTAPPPRVVPYVVRRTTDGGQTWASPSGFPAPPSGYKLLIDSRTAFAVTPSRAQGADFRDLLLTRDAGATWALVDTVPYETQNVERFVQTDGRYLYYVNDRLGGTATEEGGLFRRPLADYGLATAAEGTPEASGLTLAAFPNPARASATLRVTLAEAQSVRVTLTDVLGREALALDRALPAGASAVPLDVSGLAPGIYVARLVSPGASASVRFTVAR